MEQPTKEKAKLYKRAIALAVDLLAMVVLSWITVFAMSFLTAPFVGSESQFGQFMLKFMNVLIAAVTILFQFLYFGYFWSREHGQSLGMKIMAINVTREDGSRLGFLRAGLRGSVGYWISGLVFWLGFIWAAIDKNGEAWHDKIFDTRVFEHPYDPYGAMNFPAPRPPTDAGPDMR
jgi:uncharacterized RDD family membrane protein YckC